MNDLQLGDWIKVDNSMGELGIGKVFWIDKGFCCATFFAEPNSDGSPSSADSRVEFEDIIEIIADKSEIGLYEAMMEGGREMQNLWPEWEGEVQRRVKEILYGAPSNANYLETLDEAIQYLSSVKTKP